MGQLDQDFEDFWKRYPRRVAKGAARKAYEKARKRGVTQLQMFTALALYIKHKPDYADFCHPATWINQERYEDEWGEAPISLISEEADWFAECQEIHGGECGLDRWRHATRKKMEGAA